MAEFNINNLELDDNSFYVLPEGDYHFKVASHEVGYATSEKLPPNTQQITCYLEIPIIEDGETKTVTVRNSLNVYKKALFAIRQFVECVGMVPEKGKVKIDMDKIDGLEGVCSIVIIESSNGNEFNRVQTFYPPSKAPAVTLNDEAWKKRDDFLEVGEEADVPFID
jgi:hypothetical protein